MKKNVIWWVGVKNDKFADKYGNFDYFEYSKKTWQHFCKRFDCYFIEFNEPIEPDIVDYRVNWQKAIFVFDELERRGVEYDQICLVDSSCMYKWDAPNFFELTEHKFTAWRDMDNLKWIYESILGYKDLFDNFELDLQKYFSSGFIIFNEKHKKLFEGFKKFYIDNKTELLKLQDQTVRKGTEQTPLNYWVQKHNVEVKMDLSPAFKLTHMQRYDLFRYNWQLKKDNTPYFIKYGYNWIFNGIPKNQRSNVMKQVWDMVKDNYQDNE